MLRLITPTPLTKRPLRSFRLKNYWRREYMLILQELWKIEDSSLVPVVVTMPNQCPNQFLHNHHFQNINRRYFYTNKEQWGAILLYIIFTCMRRLSGQKKILYYFNLQNEKMLFKGTPPLNQNTFSL